MTTASIKATLGANLGEGKWGVTLGATADVTGLSTASDTAAALVVTDAVPVAAALAVLVTDGASPTQAHVTTLNNAYTTLAAAITAAKAATVAAKAATAGDVVVSVNQATVTTRNQITDILRKLLNQLPNFGIVT